MGIFLFWCYFVFWKSIKPCMERNNIRVLIAEDDFLIAEEIAQSLKNLGYNLVGIAPNGKKALELTNSLKPDVVLMDIKMPKMDGLEAARLIFEQCPTPVVIITAHESHDLVEKASQSGIAAYLTKPPKTEEIDRAVTIALARHNDMVRYKNVIAELEDNKQKLHLLNASKDRFFSILAHDLRSPVSSLSVFIDQLMLNIETFEKHELMEYLSVIRNTSKSLSDLLENLLLWASFQVDRIEITPKDIGMQNMVTSVENLFSTALQNKTLKFENHVQADCWVRADEYMVNTILRNLISNAVKFTPPGGTIEILTEEDGDEVIVSVKDSGIGISDENLVKIFRLDQQISSTGTSGEKGTGLGLLLCREMVQKNHGTIWVESLPGKGSVFSFTMPRSKKEQC